ncbi:MocR-like pyridoxine biosynthesis transcription factor PdxR [Paludibacterium paludis]|uniref:Putative 8-amino-7-oxononanoate synthase n=1 Tax=Paludibacterium paludis TaxID=1225769 RepID=A0A918NYP9_9NEIS|nr:PLP-dependent aminotransferase family protein [Paludibacterium paludis]GGY05993.1 GntR family transcriptional regulator [Paludibacterium paludis]
MPNSLAGAELTARLDRAAPEPLGVQIARRLREAILCGDLSPGQRVPSIRALASELGVARGTVETVYAQLIGEGFLEAGGQAGTRVSAAIIKGGARHGADATPVAARQAVCMTLPYQPGLPALDAFPRKLWNRIALRAIRRQGADAFAYPDPCGYEPLRRAIAGYLRVARGIPCSADQVFVTAGYPLTLALLGRLLLSPADSVWIEDPGYPPVGAAITRAGATGIPVPVDDEGMRVDLAIGLAPDARLAVVTPSQHSPLGMPLSAARQTALLDWAASHGAWIIEDDYEGEFRHRGQTLPALAGLDRGERVIYAGTFSKTLYPGLRLSYFVAPPSLSEACAAACRAWSGPAPTLIQSMAAAFIEEGYFARHLKKMRALYRTRRALCEDGLREVFGSRVRISPQPGGMHLVASFDGMTDDRLAAARAREAGLAVIALSNWTRRAREEAGLMLGFANITSRDMSVDLARRLAHAIGQSSGVQTRKR